LVSATRVSDGVDRDPEGAVVVKAAAEANRSERAAIDFILVTDDVMAIK
jgi:hypothetical protein